MKILKRHFIYMAIFLLYYVKVLSDFLIFETEIETRRPEKLDFLELIT